MIKDNTPAHVHEKPFSERAALVTFSIQGSTPEYLVQEFLNRRINVVASYRNYAVIDFDDKGVAWALRASAHYFNTIEEIDQFTDAVAALSVLR